MRHYSESEINHMTSSQINQNRKLINSVLLKISNEKHLVSSEEMGKNIIAILKQNTNDITLIYDEEKNTFVHILVNEEKLETLKIIVEAYYLDLDKDTFYKWFTSENDSKLTPLDISAQKGNKEIIKYLFGKISKTEENVLRLNEKRNSFFHYAAKKNQIFPIIYFYEELKKYFPNKKFIDNPNEHLITPLHYACYHNSLKVIDLLLDLGADINARDCNDKSVLIYGVYSGSVRLIKKLLLRGANKFLKDDTGKTAYQFAIENRKYNIAKLLKTKNVFKKMFCNSLELSSIKGIRNDDIAAYSFISYFIFIAFFLISYLNKRLSQTNGYFKKVFLPISSLVFCFLGLGTVFIAFIQFIYFTTFFKRKQSHFEEIQEGSSLIDLIENSDDICVKCKRNVSDDTIHCLVCDICVDNWDHHCFWLNTCIDINMKTKFNLFFIFLFIGTMSNLIFGIIEIIILSLSDCNLRLECLERKVWLVLISLFIVIFIYLFGFILMPLCFCLIAKKEDFNQTNASEFESRLFNRSLNKSSFD